MILSQSTLRGAFLMPIFIQRAQHQRIHTLGMDSLYVSVRTSFRHGSNRLSCMVLAGLYFSKYQKRNE